MAVAVASVMVAGAVTGGGRVLRPLDVGLDASPLTGRWDWHGDCRFALPVAVALIVVRWGPTVAAGVRWSLGLGAAAASASIWAASLALTDGWSRLTAPLTTRYEYEPFAASIDDPIVFLRSFATRATEYPTHVKSHPPGATLVPWVLDSAGLGGAGWFAALVIAAWGVAVAAVLVAVRTASGEAAARRAAPAAVLLPAALWAATSADALFAAVFAVGIALAVRPDRRAAVAGGVVLGAGLLLSYGGVLLIGVPVGFHVLHRRWVHAAAIVAVVLVALIVVWVGSGFWWLDGLNATRELYWSGVAPRRPGLYLTLIGNPAALLLALGPATVAGVGVAVVRRSVRTVAVPALGLVAVVVADLSQLSRGEVERVWLAFAVLISGAAVGDRRPWLAAQAGAAIVVQAAVVSPW